MANTGNKICLTLEQINAANEDEPTGLTKPNTVGDADYIPPVLDLTTCPVVADTACPEVVYTGGTGTIEYEFSPPPTVMNNTSVAYVKVSLYLDAVLEDSINQTKDSYHTGIFAGLAADTYEIVVSYLDSSSVELDACTPIEIIVTA